MRGELVSAVTADNNSPPILSIGQGFVAGAAEEVGPRRRRMETTQADYVVAGLTKYGNEGARRIVERPAFRSSRPAQNREFLSQHLTR
jgi:hypothetical protein